MEEGEMVADLADNDGDSYISNRTGYPGSRQLQAEQSVEPENSSGMELFIPATFDIGEIDPPLIPEEKNDGGVAIENIVESSDKLNDGSETGGETDQFSGAVTTTTEEASTSSYVDTVASEQGFPTVTQDTGGKPVSALNSSSTTINLQSGIGTSSLSRPRVREVCGRGVRGGFIGEDNHLVKEVCSFVLVLLPIVHGFDAGWYISDFKVSWNSLVVFGEYSFMMQMHNELFFDAT